MLLVCAVGEATVSRDQTFTELIEGRSREAVKIVTDVQELSRMDEEFARWQLREMIRSYLSRITVAPHFHICNGPRPGGHFYQSEAWEVRDMVLDHVTRVIEREASVER